MRQKAELHVVIDLDGVRSVQIIGPSEVHSEGHDLYFNIRDLVMEFDRAVQKRLREREEEEFGKASEH